MKGMFYVSLNRKYGETLYNKYSPSEFIVNRRVYDISERSTLLEAKKAPFDCFEEAFDYYQKLYQMDKMMFDILRHSYKLEKSCFEDSSNDAIGYSFTVGDRHLFVQLEGAIHLAFKIFHMDY